MEADLNRHTEFIELEMSWLSQLIDLRIKTYFQTEENLPPFQSVIPPELPEACRYHQTLIASQCTWLDRMILVLCLAPHVKPQVLDPFFMKNKNLDRGFTEFGGVKGENHGGFLPTVETASFLFGGEDAVQRQLVLRALQPDGPLRKSGLVKVGSNNGEEPKTASLLFIEDFWVQRWVSGAEYAPEANHDFPAKKLETAMNWEHLVLDEEVMDRLMEIQLWMHHKPLLLVDWGLGSKVKRGFRCLFHGPPGTGKTLSATLLGKSLKLPVFRVDLSQVVSKYIGETEKNLSRIFDVAEHRNWILFFDEADALFGKRVQTSTSNDRHANQEIAFLLQRIEDFDGLVILATNLKINLDEAFARRFQSMIYFPPPGKEERLELWKNYFGGKLPVADNIDFERLAEDYEVTGGNIVNVLRYASLQAVSRQEKIVTEKDIRSGVKRELRQMGKSL